MPWHPFWYNSLKFYLVHSYSIVIVHLQIMKFNHLVDGALCIVMVHNAPSTGGIGS